MILYKKDTKGKIRSLEIYADKGILYQISGLLDGAKVVHEKECKPKNTGRANATSKVEQAEAEVEALITLKLKEGYSKTIEETDIPIILPMLAHEYKKNSKKVDWKNAYVQPKLDGCRAISLGLNNLTSRKNNEIDTLSHLYPEINILHSMGINIPDGEVYVHGLPFQENIRLIKKYRRGETEKIKYHIYDQILDVPFVNRYNILQDTIESLDLQYIELVPTFKVRNEAELLEYHQEFIARGYEGTILRHGNTSYEADKRSYSLLKFKNFKDITLPVLDVIPGDANSEHGYFIFEWAGAKGHPKGDNILGCGMKFSHSDRIEFLKNKKEYIGKAAEIRFFEYSETGVPRFPQCVGFRIDK